MYVRELDQLFDSMDPSPFHEKNLDRNAHEYIVSFAKELSASAPTALAVYLATPAGLPDEGRILGDAIRAYFARSSEMLRREMRQVLRHGWISLIIGLSLVVSSVIVGQVVARRMGQGPLVSDGTA